MKKSAGILLAVFLLAVGAAPLAHAAMDDNDRPSFSLTPYAGAGLWSERAGFDNSFIFGGRAALHLNKSLSIEGTYGRSDVNRTADDVTIGLSHYGFDLVWDLIPNAKYVPYLTGGWSRINHKPEMRVRTATFDGGEIGFGLKTRLSGDNASYKALRVEIRDVINSLADDFANNSSTTHNFIATVGVQFAFGQSSRDTDGDGVRDRDDNCANTPKGAMVDAVGCPTDSDGDGVFDGLDKCKDTPRGATVDRQGCPMDSDGNGVYDGLDMCADTPQGATVGNQGCPMDSDGDGVYDGLDNCPDTEANLQVDAGGCPIAVTETEIQLLDSGRITTTSIVFATNSDAIEIADSDILQEIGETLSRWPDVRMEIIGHTDDTGSAAYNQKLSQRRADSVLAYLRANYPDIDTTKYKSTGMGEAVPIADNKTKAGRRANRRVEFKVLNPDELKREIEHRKMLQR